jgi:hypothetical protein
MSGALARRIAPAALAAALLLALVGAPHDGAADVLPPTLVTAAGAGIFPSGAQLSGVQLTGGSFGDGVAVNSDGTARGDFQTILAGTTLLGTATKILVVGWVTGGTANADGSVTIGGTCRVDMQDGTIPSTGVPFTAAITTGGFQLTIGTTALPTLVKSAGWIYIERP